MLNYTNDGENDELPCNDPPTLTEIAEIIHNKKNGKASTDIKNEMLKKPGETMVGYVYTLMRTIWKEENIPDQWKKGLITSIWKGKGDRESLSNHRGITVSSSIGNIMEELIDNRILKTVKYTQAQGGGLKGSSTYDHVFLIHSIISISLKQKRKTFLTFYDVKKAFDNVDNNDMIAVMWEKGLKGKTWRILKNLSNNLLTAVKTKYGTTRDINIEIGKQGSKLTENV